MEEGLVNVIHWCHFWPTSRRNLNKFELKSIELWIIGNVFFGSQQLTFSLTVLGGREQKSLTISINLMFFSWCIDSELNFAIGTLKTKQKDLIRWPRLPIVHVLQLLNLISNWYRQWSLLTSKLEVENKPGNNIQGIWMKIKMKFTMS